MDFYFLRVDILFLFLILTLFRLINTTENPCDNQTDGAFVRDPMKCEHFFQCRNGEPLTAACPDGMYFDPESGICDISDNVFCEHDHIDPENDDEEEINCPQYENEKVITFIGSNINCNRYYICYHGIALKQECIPELHWNTMTKKCDYPEKAKCTATNIRCNDEFIKQTLPHPINCRFYYYCIHGLPLLQRCPFFHHFDIQSRSCKWENKAHCWANELLKNQINNKNVDAENFRK